MQSKIFNKNCNTLIFLTETHSEPITKTKRSAVNAAMQTRKRNLVDFSCED